MRFRVVVTCFRRVRADQAKNYRVCVEWPPFSCRSVRFYMLRRGKVWFISVCKLYGFTLTALTAGHLPSFCGKYTVQNYAGDLK